MLLQKVLSKKIVYGFCIKIDCPTIESAMAVINQAMQMRLFLSANDTIGFYDLKPADSRSKLLGAIGSMFVVVNIEQLVYNIASGESKTRESTLEFILFPSAEALNFKPEKEEEIHFISHGEFSPLNNIIPIAPEEAKVSTNKLLISLQIGLQALSTVGRVVNALRANVNGDPNITSNGSTALLNGKQHIPYRDSLFTRLLKPSLSGNCSVFMVTPVNGKSDNIVNNLRFASDLGGLYNSMWTNDSPKLYLTFLKLPPALQKKLAAFIEKAFQNADRANGVISRRPSIEPVPYELGGVAPLISPNMVAFNSVLSKFQENVSDLADFSALYDRLDVEKERAQALSSMGITLAPPVQNFVQEDDQLNHQEDSFDSTRRKSLSNLDKNLSRSHDPNDMKGPVRKSSLEQVVWGKVDQLSAGQILPKLQNQMNKRRMSKNADDLERSRTAFNSMDSLETNHSPGKVVLYLICIDI
jgi:hypothetical protein